MTISERQSVNPGIIRELVSALASNDVIYRESSRDTLVAIATPDVARALIIALNDSRRQVRWEAAKALTAIADSTTAPALVDALNDDDTGVRWVAAGGIIALDKEGLVALLNGLMRHGNSSTFCNGAHHVLRELSEKGFDKVVTPVMYALKQSYLGVSIPPAAYAALLILSDTPF